MAYEILKIRQNTYEVYADGQERAGRGNRRAEQIMLNSFQQAVFDRKVFQASIGSATTPVSFAKTAYDADQPQLAIDVPAGKAIVPLELMVMFEDSAGTDNEIIHGASGTLSGAGTSTAVTYALGTLQNMWVAPDGGVAPVSSCSVYSLYTGNGTDTTAAADFREIDRWVYAFADTTVGPVKEYHWKADSQPTCVINGAGSWVIWIAAASTAPAGFVRAKWWELDASEV